MQCSGCGSQIETGSSFCVVCGKHLTAGFETGLTIGRDPANDLVISDERVSRQHAVITRQGEVWTISDRNSRNGVWVNGQRVASAQVSPRDKILLADQVTLDWNAVQSAFQRKTGGAEHLPPPPPASYSPLPIKQAQLKGKRSPALIYVALGIVVLAVLGTVYYLYFWNKDSGKNAHKYRIKTIHTYLIRLGEDKDMALLHSRLESIEQNLQDAADSLEAADSPLTYYCCLDQIVRPDPVVESPSGLPQQGSGKVICTVDSYISDKDYKARVKYLNGKDDFLTQISSAEQALQQRKAQLKVAEKSLASAAGTESGREIWTQAFSSEEGYSDQGLDTGGVDVLRVPLQAYEKALHELEAVYTSLDPIRKELLAIPKNNTRSHK